MFAPKAPEPPPNGKQKLLLHPQSLTNDLCSKHMAIGGALGAHGAHRAEGPQAHGRRGGGDGRVAGGWRWAGCLRAGGGPAAGGNTGTLALEGAAGLAMKPASNPEAWQETLFALSLHLPTLATIDMIAVDNNSITNQYPAGQEKKEKEEEEIIFLVF